MTHREAHGLSKFDLISRNLPQLLTEAETIVDLYLAADRLEARLVARNARLCKHCRAPYEDHGRFTDGCPAPAHTKFSILTCQASVFDKQCEAECVPGSEFCMNHQPE